MVFRFSQIPHKNLLTFAFYFQMISSLSGLGAMRLFPVTQRYDVHAVEYAAGEVETFTNHIYSFSIEHQYRNSYIAPSFVRYQA